MDELSALRYVMSMIASSCQHCDEQQFQSLSVYIHDCLRCKVKFIIRALTRDHILALEKLLVRLAYILYCNIVVDQITSFYVSNYIECSEHITITQLTQTKVMSSEREFNLKYCGVKFKYLSQLVKKLLEKQDRRVSIKLPHLLLCKTCS